MEKYIHAKNEKVLKEIFDNFQIFDILEQFFFKFFIEPIFGGVRKIWDSKNKFENRLILQVNPKTSRFDLKD